MDTTFNPPPLIIRIDSYFQDIFEPIAVQADGRIIVAGGFRIPGINLRAPIVRLNADGSFDSSFNFAVLNDTDMSGVIKDVEIRADGRIFIAGNFSYTSPAGVTRTNLARINPDGSTDETFNPPGVSLPIDDIAVQPDGKVIGFAATDSVGNRFFRRLNEDGSLDTSFTTVVGGEVLSVKIQPDGKIVICGLFGAVNNVTRLNIARVNADGSLDQTFTSPLFHIRLQPYDVEIENDGRILISGTISSSVGPTGGLFMRLNANGTIAQNFDALTPNNGYYIQIFDLALQANGQTLLVGNMKPREFADQTGGGASGAAANRINADGTYDNTFRTPIGIRGSVADIAPLPNGQTVIGGVFDAVNQAIRYPRIARLNADGSTDTTFIPMIPPVLVLAVTPLPDNRVMVGGGCIYGWCSGMLARLNLDGSRDTTFNPQLSNGQVHDIAVQPDGKVIAAGPIASLDYSTCCVMRFNPDGSVDSSFRFPVGIWGVIKVLVQPDGKILIGGVSSGGSFSRSSVARLNADGSIDTSFNPASADNTVTDIALQTDGKVLISGEFSQVNRVSRQGLARLNADGSLDTTFDATANSSVFAVELQADGKILVGGAFTSIGGAARNRIARLNPNGSIDSTFNVGTGTDGNVLTIALDASGRVLAGGEFVRYNNAPRVGIVRLLNDIAP